MLVVVAADPGDAPEVRHQLVRAGATTLTQAQVGRDRMLVYGGPFDDRQAAVVAATLRRLGWPVDVRPESGGHLAAWRANCEPVCCGRVTVCLPWSEFDRDRHDNVVEIDPGRAFGTGAHPSTSLLLGILSNAINGGEHLLDVGCGTGVLAIAAATLGAAPITAVDVSPAAVVATRANAARNRVSHTVAVSSTPVARLTGRYDVIVANIEASTLVTLSGALTSRLTPGGWLALSGLSPAQTSLVEASYRPLRVTQRARVDDWEALVLAE